MILPPQATDCHMHVLGPYDLYPLVAARAYNVPEAPLEAHESMKRRVGLDRTVLVQASGHGNDNRAMLSALQHLGARGRGIAVVRLETPTKELDALQRRGVCGLRLNLVTLASRHAGDRARLVREHARLAAPLGWHLQIFADAATLLLLKDSLFECCVPVVIDHMGLPDAAEGIGQPAFQTVLQLLAAPHVWVKVAGADRITRGSGRLRDAIPFMRALAAVAPERVVWGSDWPHIGFHSGTQVQGDEVLPFRPLDAGELLDILAEAVPDPQARHRILVANPARLYGFAQAMRQGHEGRDAAGG